MRRVTRSYISKPNILKDHATLLQLENIAKSGSAASVSPRLYSDPYPKLNGNGSRVLDKLHKWYKGKCAYCERRYKLDVEHFRPKGRITDENNRILSATGYYWLCYEWSNLLPSCISCNREGGKVDKFPTINARVSTPSFHKGRLMKSRCLVSSPKLVAEIPYLINPEVDDPANFFKFKISDNGKGIEIVGIDPDNRGDRTQKICKLNRDELRIERATIIQEFSTAVLSVFKLNQLGIRNDAQLKSGIENLIQALYDNAQNVEFTHTLLRKYIIASQANFDAIVLRFLPPNARSIVKKAFSNYIPI